MNDLIRTVAYCLLIVPGLLISGPGQNLFGFGAMGFALSMVLYAVVLFLVVLVHELGHAIAALSFGWRVTLFAVFPIAYRPKTRKLGLWVLPSGDLGGAVSVSTGDRGRTRSQSAQLAAAGPLANVVFASLMFFLIYLAPAAQDILGFIAVSSLFVGLGNLLPWKTRNGIRSDGALIAAALRRKSIS